MPKKQLLSFKYSVIHKRVATFDFFYFNKGYYKKRQKCTWKKKKEQATFNARSQKAKKYIDKKVKKVFLDCAIEKCGTLKRNT